MKTLYAVLGAVLALGPTESKAQNLLTNGSFEVPAHVTNNIAALSAGSTTLSGWVLQGAGSIFLVTTPLQGSAFMALDGQQFISFNAATLTLSQSFTTRPGESYEVSFTAGLFQGSTNMQILGQVVSTNGSVLGSLTAGVPQTAGWSAPSRFRFTATTPISILQFQGTNCTPNVDLVMDAVTVEPVSPRLTIDVSQVRICWESQTNRSYQLQSSSNLAANTWNDVGQPILGTGTTDCTLQAATNGQRFFRVLLLP